MSGWGRENVTLYRNALPIDLLARLLADAVGLSRSDNYWTCCADYDEAAGNTAPEQAVALLYKAFIKDRIQAPCSGAEWWAQVFKPGHGLGFHFDKDEFLMRDQHVMANPDLSSILYLTGCADSGSNTERLGPTVILDQRHDAELGPQPETPSRCALVWPRAGNYCIFNGQLGHGVLDSPSQAFRATLLVNWWSAKPQDINPATPEQRAALQRPVSLPDSGGRAKAQTIHTLQVPDGDQPLLVDDLLQGAGLHITGPAAADAVVLDHEGFELYPLAEESYEQEQGRLVTAAALVPTGACQDSSGSDDEV